MSEQLQDVNAQAQPAAPTLSPEQFEQIKRSLVDSLHKNYGQFIGSIQQFPVAAPPMQEAFKHFDTGFLWFKEAILNMPMPVVQMMPMPPQSEAPSEQAMAHAVAETSPANEAMQEEVAQPLA